MKQMIMIKVALVVLFITIMAMMSSCYHEPVSSTTTENGVDVELLFEKDGVRVYRFWDGGNKHYFTTRGETMSATNSKDHHDENINAPQDQQ